MGTPHDSGSQTLKERLSPWKCLWGQGEGIDAIPGIRGGWVRGALQKCLQHCNTKNVILKRSWPTFGFVITTQKWVAIAFFLHYHTPPPLEFGAANVPWFALVTALVALVLETALLPSALPCPLKGQQWRLSRWGIVMPQFENLCLMMLSSVL